MTARHTVIALLCVVLVSTAGCSGVMDADSQPSTTTDATASTTTGNGTTGQLAPGLTNEGVTDALALADAHLAQLKNESFGKVSRVAHPNAANASYRQSWLSVANESHWRWKVTAEGMPLALDATRGVFWQYADGEQVLWRLLASGNTTRANVTYGVRSVTADGERVPVPPAQVFPSAVYERDLVYSLFGNADVTVENASGSTVHVSGTADELAIDREQVANVEFSATVTAEGLVKSLDLTYEQDGRVVERTFSFDTVYDGPVDRPVWYDTAENQTDV